MTRSSFTPLVCALILCFAVIAVPPGANPSAMQSADDQLPLLTPRGRVWAQRLIVNATRVTQGQRVTQPPFVTDLEIAQAIALTSRAVRKAAVLTPENLLVDADWLALRDLIAARVSANDVPTFADELDVYRALNDQQVTFPAPAPTARFWYPFATVVTAQSVDPAKKILKFVGTLAGVNPESRDAERRVDGRVVPARTISHPEQVASVYFVNGVQTPLVKGEEAAATLSARLERDIHHIHNRAAALPLDLVQAVLQSLNLSNDPAVETTKILMLEHARAGTASVFTCHSQGAAICAAAQARALSEAPLLHDAIRDNVRIVTLGGFSNEREFLSGTATHLVRDGDVVPSLWAALDPTNPLRQLRALLELTAALTLERHDLLSSYAGVLLPQLIEAIIASETSMRRPVLGFDAPEYSVFENAGSANVTVVRSVNATRVVTVRFTTQDGSATAGPDYASTALTLVFGTGETQKTVSVPIVSDSVAEGEETVTLLLSSPTSGAVLGARPSALLRIREPIEVVEVSTRSGWTGQLLATRKSWTIGGQQFVEVVRYGVTKRICPSSGVFLDCPTTWNVWKFVPLPGHFMTPGGSIPTEAMLRVTPDNVFTEGCEDLDPSRRFSAAPAACPPTITNDATFIASTAQRFGFPLCFSTHSCGIYDPSSPYLGSMGYTTELLTGCISEPCPAGYDCPPPCLPSSPTYPACLTEGHCPRPAGMILGQLFSSPNLQVACGSSLFSVVPRRAFPFTGPVDEFKSSR